MTKEIFVKPFVNKRNGQITLHPKRKNLPKKLVDNIFSIKKIKLTLEGWE